MSRTIVYFKDKKKYLSSFVDDTATHEYKSLFDLLKDNQYATKIYTTNLGKMGGLILIKELLANGFKYNANSLLKEKEFFYLIDTNYTFLFIRVKYSRRVVNIYDLNNFYNVEEIDSLQTIEAKLDTLKYAVKALPGGHAYTLTGQTANEYKKYLKKRGVWLNVIFERLAPYVEKYCSQAFVGGICMYNRKYLEQKLNVYQYDFNNLYGYILANCMLPFGQPQHVVGNSFEMLDDYTVSIQHIKARVISKSRVKWFKMKTDINFYEKTIADTRYVVDLWLTNIDFEELKKDYTFENVEYIDGYVFQASKHLFDDYVNANYDKKASAPNGWIEQLYKGYNNRLFGYFGKRIRHNYLEFSLTKNKCLATSRHTLDTKPVYSPLSAFVSAYGRRMILGYIRKYYDDWIYTDCDSLFMTREIEELPVSAKLGDFKLKTGVAKFFGTKKYIFNYETYFAGLKKQKLSYNVNKGDVIVSKQYKYTASGEAKAVDYKYTI